MSHWLKEKHSICHAGMMAFLAAVLALSYYILTGGYTLVPASRIVADPGGPPGYGGKYVAITFDDGPKPGTTDLLLEGLRQRDVQATFFLIGRQIEGNELLIRQMYEDGHQIGNHTFNHKNLEMLSADQQIQELSDCFEAVAQITGQKGCFVRPPYGEIDKRVQKDLHCPIILWSVDTKDWTEKSADDIARYIIDTAEAGDIILLHDIYRESVEGALMAIDAMKDKGYTFVTVSELFEKNGIEMEPGKIYRKTYH